MNQKGKKVGKRIKEIREWRKITQEELARAIGASSLSYIQRIENEETNPSIDRLDAIARYLGVCMTDLFVSTEKILKDQKFYKFYSIENQEYYSTEDYDFKPLIDKEIDKKLFSHPPFHAYAVRHKRTPSPIYHRHPGWELVILRKGSLMVQFRDRYDRNKIVLIESLKNFCDVLFFDSSSWHAHIPEQDETESIGVVSDLSGYPLPKENNFEIIKHNNIKKYNEEIGERIQKIREGKGISLRELADKIGKSQSFISRIEQGRSVPALDSLYEIARYLKINLADFFIATKPRYELFKTFLLDDEKDQENKKILIKDDLGDYNYKMLSGKYTLPYQPSFHPYLRKHHLLDEDKTIYHRHHGWELVILRSGRLNVRFKKEYAYEKNIYETSELKNPFDVLLFSSNTLHAYKPMDDKTTSLCVISDIDIENTIVDDK